MEKTKLNNDVEMPVLGLGTFLMLPVQAEKAVYDAFECGYEMIDTANAYMNEKAVGRGIRKAGKNDVFLVSKLWPTVYEEEDAVEKRWHVWAWIIWISCSCTSRQEIL